MIPISFLQNTIEDDVTSPMFYFRFRNVCTILSGPNEIFLEPVQSSYSDLSRGQPVTRERSVSRVDKHFHFNPENISFQSKKYFIPK